MTTKLRQKSFCAFDMVSKISKTWVAPAIANFGSTEETRISAVPNIKSSTLLDGHSCSALNFPKDRPQIIWTVFRRELQF